MMVYDDSPIPKSIDRPVVEVQPGPPGRTDLPVGPVGVCIWNPDLQCWENWRYDHDHPGRRIFVCSTHEVMAGHREVLKEAKEALANA